MFTKKNNTDGPIKTLKGFQRVTLDAGSTENAVVNLPASSFEFFDRESGQMVISPGEYEILYGNSSNDSDLKMTILTIK